MLKMIKDEEIEQVKSNLHFLPTLVESFGSFWINITLLTKTRRKEKHVLFWLLLDLAKSQKLENWLKTLKSSLISTKFQGIVNSLKRKSRRIEFYSLLSEIEVLAYYMEKRDRYLDIEYEPRHGDIKITIDGCEVFLEIAKLFSSKDQQKINTLENLVWEKLDNLENNVYILSFGISAEFSESDVDLFVKFARKKIAEKIREFPSEKFVFNNGKAWIKIDKVSPRNRGYVGRFLTGVMKIESARRLKNKILDEVKQLPEDHLSIVVYNISAIFTRFDHIEDAFFGQPALRINRRTLKTKPIRHPNGVIHTEEGKRVSAIISFKDFEYENHKTYVNPFANISLPQEIKAKL